MIAHFIALAAYCGLAVGCLGACAHRLVGRVLMKEEKEAEA